MPIWLHDIKLYWILETGHKRVIVLVTKTESLIYRGACI